MAETNIERAATTDMKGTVTDYSVDSEVLESPEATEKYYTNPDFAEYLGYYKNIPELKKSIDALAMWTAGKGWTADRRTETILETIEGWGEDSFDSIIQNMLVMKKVNGDAFAEIIMENGRLINLKPLNPSKVRIVVGKNGVIKRYDYFQDKKWMEIKKSNMFHLCNDRIADEIHGTSVIEACKWVIDARNESMSDFRRTLHRSTIRVIEIDTDNRSKINSIRQQYAEAIKNGEVLLVPKGNFGFPDAPINIINPEAWIKYLEDFFYQAVGVPKIILGGSQEFTEASSKIGYLTFEQVYMAEQRLLEQDIFGQLALEVKFERPVSLKTGMMGDEEKNTGQVGIQANDTQIDKGKTATEEI